MQTIDDFVQFRKTCPFCNADLLITLDYDHPGKITKNQVVLKQTVWNMFMGRDFITGYNIRPKTNHFYISNYDRNGVAYKNVSDKRWARLVEYVKNRRSKYAMDKYCHNCYYCYSIDVIIDLDRAKIILEPASLKEMFFGDDDGEVENSIPMNSVNLLVPHNKQVQQIQLPDTYFDPTNLPKVKNDIQFAILFS
jgi:hypothetical protein